MNNKVKISQIALLLLIPGGKFLSIPMLLAANVGRDSWIVLTLLFAVDAICITFLLWSVKLNKNGLTSNGILTKTLGTAVTKVVFAVFFVVVMCRLIAILTSCYKLFAVTFTVKTNWPAFMLPIAGVALFAVSRGFRTLARANQLLIGLVLVAVFSVMALPAMRASLADLLPVGESGWGKILSTAKDMSFWFADYVFLYFVLGDVVVQKKVFSPVLFAFAAGAVMAIGMNVIFLSLYGSMAQYSDLAISKIGLFVAETTNGRWDWLSLSVWAMSVFLKLYILFFSAYKCVEYLFRLPSSKFNVWAGVAITAILFVPMFVTVDDFLGFVNRFLFYPMVAVQYVLTLFMPLLTFKANKKQVCVGEAGYEKS